MDLSLRLPTELLWSVLDHATLPDIVRASLVCHRWRSLSFEHKSYWGQVYLIETHDTEVRAAAAEFALARMSRSSASPVDVHILLYHSQPWIDDLLASIQDNLRRIRDLRVRLPKVYHQRLRSLVSVDAPLLEHLDLAVQRVNWELPRTLTPGLTSRAPRLRVLHLSRFSVHDDDRDLFQHVYDLSLRGSTTLDATVVAAKFPNAREFIHRGRQLEYPENESIAPSVANWLSGLQYLNLHRISLEQIAHWGAIERIPTIRVDNPTVHITNALLCHFDNSDILLELERYVFPRQPMNVSQPSSGLTRILDFVNWVWLPDVAQLRKLAPQVVELALPASSWEEASLAVGDPPRLRHITIQLDEPLGDVVIKHGDHIPPVYAPALETLTITGHADISAVDGDGLLEFTDGLLVLHGNRERVRLELRDIAPGVWPDGLQLVFDGL